MIQIGKHHIHYPETDSTNLACWRLLKQKALPEGTLITAGYQTHGKGQAAARWESRAGQNLLFSVVLYPRFLPPSRQFWLNMVLSVALVETMAHISGLKGFLIKWPNDLLFGQGKVAGMLIENSIMLDQLDCCVAGLGINVNQGRFSSQAPHARSLRQITGKKIPLDQLLQPLCQSMSTWYEKLKDNRLAAIRSAYENSLWGHESWRLFKHKGRIFEGRIRGVNDFGQLLLENRYASVQAYDLKELSFLFGDAP